MSDHSLRTYDSILVLLPRAENPTPFVWTKTADEILDKLARYCTAVTNTEYDSAST